MQLHDVTVNQAQDGAIESKHERAECLAAAEQAGACQSQNRHDEAAAVIQQVCILAYAVYQLGFAVPLMLKLRQQALLALQLAS